jgi:hypothetical protein
MLPSFAELGGSIDDSFIGSDSQHNDAFDEASFGVWTTIMNSGEDSGMLGYHPDRHGAVRQSGPTMNGKLSPVMELKRPMMPVNQKERLEEFATAFLAMSVFDVCDVWIPQLNTGGYDSLCHVTSVTSTDTNEALNEFKRASEHAQVPLWSGAVGRAYASGNPVWSANYVSSNRTRRLLFVAKLLQNCCSPCFFIYMVRTSLLTRNVRRLLIKQRYKLLLRCQSFQLVVLRPAVLWPAIL